VPVLPGESSCSSEELTRDPGLSGTYPAFMNL